MNGHGYPEDVGVPIGQPPADRGCVPKDEPSCDEAGCACVAPLTPPADRLAILRRTLQTEEEPVVTLTQLLRLCRDEHPTLWEHHADPRCRARVAELMTRIAEAVPPPGVASVLDADARQAIVAALAPRGDIPAVVIAHALAELIDARYGHGFTEWFRRRSPYQPAVGDPIPLDTPDLRRVTDLPPTAPPWRLANRLDETRRIRLAGAWATQFRVVFDYGAFHALSGVIGADTVIATCHPNRELGDFDLPRDRQRPAFPVGPVDVDAQRRRIDRLLADASEAGAAVVVLPELSVTEEVAFSLETWVRRPGPLRLLVAGSFHYADPADPRWRSNRALTWVRGVGDPLIQDKHSPADQPVAEDITPPGWPEIRVHVTADGWHLVIAICRDLLNPHAVHALTEAGANLVLTPSMSETLVPFGGPVAQLVGSGQALVAVANNPAAWPDAEHPDLRNEPARAVFGHPGFGQQSRQVHAPDDRAGMALLRVRSGRLGWYPVQEEAGAESASPSETRIAAAGAPPAWLAALSCHTTMARTYAGEAVSLRHAAVLVVLTDGAGGPHVLLTGRAPDLTHYAGQLVFPGGAADPSDRDPVDTALREASEEVGLDPASVDVIGTLPAFGLPDSGFLVTPVLAWSAGPRFVHRPNPAEVAAVRTVPVGSPVPLALPSSAGRGTEHGTAGVMTSTVLDLVAGYLGRSFGGT